MMTLFWKSWNVNLFQNPWMRKWFRSSTLCYCQSPRTLSTQSPPVSGHRLGHGHPGMPGSERASLESKNMTLSWGARPPALMPYCPGHFSTWGCWTDTSRQGILKMTSFGKTFWSLWANMFLKCFPATRTQTGFLYTKIRVSPRAEVCLAFGDDTTPWSPCRPTELPEGFSWLLYLPNGLMHFCWVFLACFPNVIYFFPGLKKFICTCFNTWKIQKSTEENKHNQK